MKRHEMRKNAFILVFEKIFIDDTADEIIATAKETEVIPVSEDTEKLFRATDENTKEIDVLIEQKLKGWSIKRISRVSLAILRLAVCEMFFWGNTPVSVAINEAVELAKEFSGEEDAAYINGVLGAIVKEKLKEEN